MTDLWQRTILSGPTADGDAGALPQSLDGLLPETLADLGAVFGADQPALIGIGYWPVTVVKPTPAPSQKLADAPVKGADAGAKTWTFTYALEQRPVNELQALAKTGAPRTTHRDAVLEWRAQTQDRRGNALAALRLRQLKGA